MDSPWTRLAVGARLFGLRESIARGIVYRWYNNGVNSALTPARALGVQRMSQVATWCQATVWATAKRTGTETT
jgi:hypothetical protein